MISESSALANPFPGLRPFDDDRADVLYFFGRDVQIDELLARLQLRRMVAVIGTSGSGKSSLVNAGLLPALHGGFMAGVGSRWRIAKMRPENAPIANLAKALEACGIGSTKATLDRGALGLVEAVREAEVPADENLLILVDQFEELFHYDPIEGSETGNDPAAFVKLLLEAVAHPAVSIYVVITMRSEKLGECARFRNLPEAVNDSMFLVPRLTREQLEEVIEGPISVAGAEITPRLVNRLLNDLDDDQNQLPVLQHALMRTWDIWEGRHQPDEPIDIPDYEATGGLEHALSLHGDAVLDELKRHHLCDLAERIFKALTDTSDTRNPLPFDVLCAISKGSTADVLAVLNAFRARDVSFLRADEPLGPKTIVDLTHESLMRTWTTLQTWVQAEADAARTYRMLSDLATGYAAEREGLMTDPALSIALDWDSQEKPNAAWAQRYTRAGNVSFARAMEYLRASATQRNRGRRARARRRTLAFASLAAGLVVFILLYAWARIQVLEKIALTAEWEANSGIERSADRVGSVLVEDAYAQAQTPGTTSALLFELLNFGELTHVHLEAPWTAGAFAAKGTLFGAIAGTQDLTGTRLRIANSTLAVMSATSHAAAGRYAPIEDIIPSAICGVRTAPRFAVAGASATKPGLSEVLLYAASANAAPVHLATQHVPGRIVAMACSTSARSIETVALVTKEGAVFFLNVRTGARQALASDPGATGIVLSNTGKYAALLGPLPLQRIDLYELNDATKIAQIPLTDAGCRTCATQVSFDRSDKTVAWIDDQRVFRGRVYAPNAHPTSNACLECIGDAVLIWADDPMPQVLLTGRHNELDEATGAYEGHPEYKAIDGAPMPIYDLDSKPEDPRYATQEIDGAAMRTLADSEDPLLPRIARTSGPGRYAVTDSSLVLAGKKLSVYSFSSDARATGGDCGGATAADDLYVADSVDGEHLLCLNLADGALSVLHISDTGVPSASHLRVIGGPFVLPGSLLGPRGKYGYPRSAYTIVYDPGSDTVTVASQTGVEQFASNGVPRHPMRGRGQIEKDAGLTAKERSKCPLGLSSLGTYVRVPLAGTKCWANTAFAAAAVLSSPTTIVSTVGNATKQTFSDLWTISNDDKFAFGTVKNQPAFAYSLPSMKSIETDNVTVSGGVVNVSPDGKTLAYENGEREIALFDLGSNLSIGEALPAPPHWARAFKIGFDPKGHYLVETYVDNERPSRWWLATYDLEPSYWDGKLCEHLTDLSNDEKRQIGETVRYIKGETAELIPNAARPEATPEIAAGEEAYQETCGR